VQGRGREGEAVAGVGVKGWGGVGVTGMKAGTEAALLGFARFGFSGYIHCFHYSGFVETFCRCTPTKNS
jgi:hypothetical protein